MPPKKLIQLRVTQELHAALRRAATDDGRTMTQYIVRLITLNTLQSGVKMEEEKYGK